MFGFIYITTNKINNRQYIGKCAYNRLNGWEDYLGSGKLLKQAISKYGKENFVREIVLECATEEELNLAERNLIEANNACVDPRYYNIAEGGTGGNTRLGYTDEQYEEYCKKFSAPKESNPMWGKKHTPESNAKNKASVMKKWKDPEFIERHRLATVEAMKKVPREVFKYENRAKNNTIICSVCGNTEQVTTPQQKYCCDCKSKHSKWKLSVLSRKNDI
jgi:group I intron endonuclease